MPVPLLATKLYIPPPRPKVIPRPRLIERLNEGLHRKLSLISAPAGFGKTTLVSEWIAGCERPAAWLSLDEGDNDPTRFLAYLVAALQAFALSDAKAIAAQPSSAARFGAGLLAVLESPQPPPIEAILATLINEIITLPNPFVMVLDDYHRIDAKPVDEALSFLVEHLPSQMHLVIATREDPPIPLARLRARGELTELRAADLLFTPAEAAGFLNQEMDLNLSAENVAALETRTEGWIAGLKLAALALQGLTIPGATSMHGNQDVNSFIKNFSGSHHFVLDYLVEEVLQQQPERIQTFLLRTSILDRMCGPLCDAVLHGDAELPFVSPASGQETLEYLVRANLFIVPLDDERRWYRYHHLFAELLRQRLVQELNQQAGSSAGGMEKGVAELHLRASMWFEDQDLELESFKHAVAAMDFQRAARLVEGQGMPLIFRGGVAPVLDWLESLPAAVLDARPALWVIYASALLFVGQLTGVEQKVQAAEEALQGAELNDKTRDLIGHIASIRATLAVTQNQVETIIAQSRRALEYLHPGNLPVRTATTWALGYAYHLQGDRAEARQAYNEALAISQAIGHYIITVMCTLGLGNLQEAENQLDLAAQTYRDVLQLLGDPPLPVACEAHLGLARIYYEWNDLEAAQQHGYQSHQLARQIENNDRFVASEVFLARLKLAQGDAVGAGAILARAAQSVRQHNFTLQAPEVAAAQVWQLLHQGDLAEAAHLAKTQGLPISQARVHLARGNPSAALAMLEPVSRQAESKGWQDERLKVLVLQAVAYQVQGDMKAAAGVLSEALALARPCGFVRTFIDEGEPIRLLITDYRLWIEKQTHSQDLIVYINKLMAAFSPPESMPQVNISDLEPKMVAPLSQRELEILQLIAQGLSNQEIGEQLFLALDTVKGHNRRIYQKLQVQRRMEAVARARQLGLL